MEEEGQNAFQVWFDDGTDVEEPCLEVPLCDVPLVVDKIGLQLRTQGLRVNKTYGATPHVASGKTASLRKGTVESVTSMRVHTDPEAWLLREYLHCDAACVGCTVTFRMTVFSTSPGTCVIEYRGKHGIRAKPLKLRVGVITRAAIEDAYDKSVARTPNDIQRHLQRALLTQWQEHGKGSAGSRPRAGPCTTRFQPTYAMASQQMVRIKRKYV
jgi:hypothetical protein